MNDFDELMENAAMSVGDFGASLAEEALLKSVSMLGSEDKECDEIVGEC